jgi:biotin carboxyl carrier protein
VDLVAKAEGREARVRLDRTEKGFRVQVDERTYDVDVAHVNGNVRSLLIDGGQFVVSARSRGNGKYSVSHAGGSGDVELMDPLTHLAREAHAAGGAGGAEQVTAYMPGRVVRILVEEGQEVEAGQGVVVLEAMKMENEIQAEHSGTVEKFRVAEGQAVEGGDVLFEMSASA